MKKAENKSYYFDDELYERKYHFAVGSNKYIDSILKKYGVDHDSSAADGLMWESNGPVNGQRFVVLWCQKYDIVTLQHEIQHAVLACMDSVGINGGKDNGEPYCYYYSWIFKKIMQKTGYKKWKFYDVKKGS